MALRYDLEKIADFKTVCFYENGEMKALTNQIIWHSIVLHFQRITKQNCADIYARFKLWEGLNGALVTRGGEPYFITPADIEAHIGLETNAIAMSELNCVKSIVRVFMDQKRAEAKTK